VFCSETVDVSLPAEIQLKLKSKTFSFMYIYVFYFKANEITLILEVPQVSRNLLNSLATTIKVH
jgi:hypothetical protein